MANTFKSPVLGAAAGGFIAGVLSSGTGLFLDGFNTPVP